MKSGGTTAKKKYRTMVPPRLGGTNAGGVE